MAEHIEFIKKIPEDKPVRIFLPVKDSVERLRLSCVLQKTESQRFTLIFTSGTLPVSRIDQDAPVIVTIDLSGQTVSIEANITKIANNQTLEMVVQKTMNHEQMREYFRVDCTLPIRLRSLVPEEFGTEEGKWSLTGTTVDLSGSGLRASFTSPPPANKQVRLELSLPTAVPSIVNILTSPVRITQLTKKLWDAAYYFDDITDEDRDSIIGCCLIEQRRLLRLKVKIKENRGNF